MQDVTEMKTAEIPASRSRRGLWFGLGLLLVLVAGLSGWGYSVRSKEERSFRAAQKAIELGGWGTAVSVLNETLAIQPAFLQQHTTEAIALRGIAYFYQGDYNAAQTDLNTALTENPDLVDLYVYRASIHQQAGEYNQALADVEQALTQKDILPAHLLALAYATEAAAQDVQGNVAAAGESANAALELAAHLPNETVAALYAIRAVSEFADESPEDALSDTRHALADHNSLPDERLAALYTAETAVFFDQGDFAAALSASQSALELETGLSETAAAHLHRIRAEIYWQQGDIDSAVTEAEQATQDEANQPFYHALHSWQAYRTFDYDTAFQEATAAIEQDEDNALAYRVRGTVYIWRGEFANGLTDLNQAITLNPNDVEALAMRVYALLSYARRADAEADVAHLESIAPDAPATLWARATIILYQDDDRPLARALLNQAIAQDSQRPEFFLARSATYRLTAEFPSETADVEQALSLYPDFGPALAERLSNELEAFNISNYQAVGEQLIEQFPNWHTGYVILAAYYSEEVQDQEQALEYVNQAIDLDPALPSPYYTRGYVYLAQEEYDLARQDFERIREMAPDNTNSLNGLALISTHQQTYEEALAYREQILALQPDGLRAKSDVGFAAWDAGDLDRAWEMANAVLAVDPDYKFALVLRANLLYESEEYEEALTDIQQVIQLFPNYSWPYLIQARIFLEQGGWDEARQSAEQALELDETLTEVYLLLAFAALNEGDIDELLAQIDLFMAAADEIPVYAYAFQGYGYQQQADHEEAAEAFTSGIAIDSLSGQLYVDRAHTYQQLGEIDLAKEDLRTVLETSHDLSVLDQAEVRLVYLESTGVAAEGRVPFNNPDLGFSLSYADFWERDVSSPDALSTLVLSYGVEMVEASFRVSSFEGVEGFTAQSLANAVLSQIEDPDFRVLSQKTSSIAGETAVIVEYELDASEGTVPFTIRGRQFYLLHGDVAVIMSGETLSEDFDDYAAEFDAIAASLTFTP